MYLEEQRQCNWHVSGDMTQGLACTLLLHPRSLPGRPVSLLRRWWWPLVGREKTGADRWPGAPRSSWGAPGRSETAQPTRREKLGYLHDTGRKGFHTKKKRYVSVHWNLNSSRSKTSQERKTSPKCKNIPVTQRATKESVTRTCKEFLQIN